MSHHLVVTKAFKITIKKLHLKSKDAPHYIDVKATGKSAKQTLTQRGVVAIEIPVKAGEDKVARAKTATPFAVAGMVHIKKSMAEKLYNDSKQGILFFPKGMFKDLADALARALQRHSKNTTVVVADEEDPNDSENPLDWLD